MNCQIVDLTERMAVIVNSSASEPDFSVPIFDHVSDVPSLSLLVCDQVMVCPVSQATGRCNPQASVSRRQQIINTGGRQLLAGQRTPGNKPYAIKSKKPSGSSYPNVPIRGLRDCERRARKISVLDSPRGVTILRDTTGRIERSHHR